MTVQLAGAALLTALLRAERRKDLDTSWLLFGPTDWEEAEAEPVEEIQSWKFAAE